MDKNAKDFLKLVEEKFRSANKALVRTLMAKLTTMKFDGSKSMQQLILDMTNTAARLKTLEEARLIKQRVHSINLVNQGVDKKLISKAKNFKKKQMRLLIVKRRNNRITNSFFTGKMCISKRIVLSARLG
ncbi:hypothetical protein Tco_0774966 [Tanacetum coccineum]|uniref:Uncharacterized protein n=1 Tax=Tanacetum coccineum TaxID=301880 RepID=A0ABQ4ZQX4_9ASTR